MTTGPRAHPNEIIVSLWGNAVEMVAAGPDDRLDDERRGIMRQALLRNAERMRERHGLTWTREPEIIQPTTDFRSEDQPWHRYEYAEYDDDGYGIGEPIGDRWYFTMGWTARGYPSR